MYMTDKQYFKDYYNQHKENIIEKQSNYYYQKKLNLPHEFIPAYKKHKKVLKYLAQANIDYETIQFFNNYFKTNHKLN